MLVEARAWYAQLTLLNGEAPDTHNWASALGESYSQMIFVEIAHLTLAATWISERTPHSLAKADALLGGLRKFCGRVHNNWRLIEIGALEALLFDALGEHQKALHKLGEAIQIARKGGHIRIFVDLGIPMQQLLIKLQQKGVSPGYINRILNAFPITPVASSRNEQNHSLEHLTQRESEILDLLTQHLTNKEIAERLVLSTGTVKQHLYNIYRKLNVKNRGQAIAVAEDHNR
jgi:LuxR family maltose regulon positive regulatory protein